MPYDSIINLIRLHQLHVTYISASKLTDGLSMFKQMFSISHIDRIGLYNRIQARLGQQTIGLLRNGDSQNLFVEEVGTD